MLSPQAFPQLILALNVELKSFLSHFSEVLQFNHFTHSYMWITFVLFNHFQKAYSQDRPSLLVKWNLHSLGSVHPKLHFLRNIVRLAY